MSRSVAAVMMMAALLVASPTIAQSDKPATQPDASPNLKPDAKPAKQPAVNPSKTPTLSDPTGGEKSKTPAAKFPEKVEKKMYAKNDLRGKKAPVLKVEKWFTKEPVRKDKVILVDLWATWCGPCKALIPELESFQEKFKDDLVVIGVSDEKMDVVQKYIKEQRGNKIGYSMGIDTKGTMSKAVGVEGIPHVLIIDRDGIVRWQGFPGERAEPLTEAIVKQIIDADKAGHAKKDPTTDKKKSDPKKEARPDLKKDLPKKDVPQKDPKK